MSAIITVLTSPKTAVLEINLIESLRNSWGGGATRWLAAGEAAEFPVEHVPENFWSVWADLQEQGIDLVFQAAENRKKSMLLADMDSTMINQECIDELAAEAGVGAEVAQITARAMNGELDFEEALNARVSLLKGMKTSIIDTVLRKRITYAAGGKTLVSTMKAHGSVAVLVSGGFVDFAEPIGAELGFDKVRANRLLSKDGVLTGEVARPILGRDAKVLALKDISEEFDLSPEQVIAVGDGANDLGMLQLAGTGVALHAKPTVATQCNIRINHGDLTALLYLQGYTRSEFST